MHDGIINLGKLDLIRYSFVCIKSFWPVCKTRLPLKNDYGVLRNIRLQVSFGRNLPQFKVYPCNVSICCVASSEKRHYYSQK